MTPSKAARLCLSIVATLITAIVVFVPSAFGITTEASTVYGSTVPGAHTDYTIIQEFEYGNGPEPTASTGAGQDLKKWVVDSPAGLVGNPNAVPEADRCDPASFDPTPGAAAAYNTFFTGSCPASSQVGEAKVYLVNDANSGTCPAAPLQCILAGQDMSALSGPMVGKIYILKTDPEVPTTLGTLFTSASYQNFDFSAYGGNTCTTAPGTPCLIQPKTKSVLAPVTNRSADLDDVTDFRIRTIPAEYTNPPSALLPTAYGHPGLGSGGTPLHIRRIDQHLYGLVDPNDNFPTAGQGDTPFLTMPTRCDSWDSKSYAIDWANPTGGSTAMDPNHPGDNNYQTSNTDSVTPSGSDCAQMPTIGASSTGTLGSGERGAYPSLSIKVADSDPSDHQQPKKMITTLPASVSINVNALTNVCSDTDLAADTCPAASQVGTATISTPLIAAGLTGRVYITKGATAGLPYLSIFVDGAVKFRLDATTQFVGPSANMIETTFDNLPQTPFTDFTVNITGGSSATSLLLNRKCPADGSLPADGPITFATTGWGGSATASSSATSMKPCYGVSTPATRNSCLRLNRSATFTPQGLRSAALVRRVEVRIGHNRKGMRTRASRGSSPFALRHTISRKLYNRGWRYRFAYRVTYKDGTVLNTGSAFFRVCR
ncbi:MAG: hypothetical protein QM648_02980 [Solirubrobacterales bacterium]